MREKNSKNSKNSNVSRGGHEPMKSSTLTKKKKKIELFPPLGGRKIDKIRAGVCPKACEDMKYDAHINIRVTAQ